MKKIIEEICAKYTTADEVKALYFVLIVHTVQTMLVIALGIYSAIALSFKSRRVA